MAMVGKYLRGAQIVCGLLGVTLLVFGTVILVRALGVEEALIYPTFSPEEMDQMNLTSPELRQSLVDKFVRAVRIPTVSYTPHVYENDALLQMHSFLQESFPVVASSSLVTREVVNNYSLLYTVNGSDLTLKPYLLTAHLDVVPAEEPEKWEYPPFSGEVVEGKFIYGRGSMDDKQAVMGIMEALTYYLKSGMQPKRTLYIAFGHDEEVLGKDGAWHIAKLLEDRGVKLEFLLDEGTTVTKGIVKVVDKPVAVICTSEKGWLEVQLKVETDPGHSSMPKKESALGILARAVGRLELHPQPSMLQAGEYEAMLDHLAPHVPFHFRLALSNMWLFRPLVSLAMAAEPRSSTFIRTSTAVTIFNSGSKINVVPSVATASLNHRIHPAQPLAEVLEHDRKVIADPRVQMQVKSYMPPSPVAKIDSIGYRVVASSINHVYPEAIVVPGILFANTDSKWYLNLTHNVYRFCGLVSKEEDVGRYHGFNERISVDNYMQIINFYYRVLRNADLLSDGRDRMLRRYTEL